MDEAKPPVRSSSGTAIVVGVLSDTHGHLYPEVRRLLAGVDHIVHAGDIGSAAVLEELRRLAPVTAVRGNCDLDGWAQSLPVVASADLGGVRVVVRHQRDRQLGAHTTGHTLIVSGHSHLASIQERDGTLFLNPGSAGPQRFGRPRTLAIVQIRDGTVTADIVTVHG